MMDKFTVEDLVNAAQLTLSKQTAPDEGQVRSVLARLNAGYQLDLGDLEEATRIVLSRVVHRIPLGYKVVDPATHKPWIDAAKPKIDPYYHNRYRLMLAREGWGPNSIIGLDRTTDDIVDLLGSPFEIGTWKRRGLVIGDVQSGKTATYTSLICKAADAGYKLIVLLTGTLENLRVQTQRRLDAGFVGVESGPVLSRDKKFVRVGVGELDRRREAAVFTSTTSDFRASTLDSLSLSLRTLKEPAIVVCKKNSKILKNLKEWLETRNTGEGGTSDVPMLVIDDEADNASVNAKGAEDPTKVNAGIRELLKLFRRTTYVGVTATPFANVFIDPDSENEMLGNDLFPRDFIYALSPPTNYIGADKIFIADDGEAKFLRTIDDAEAILPAKHKADAGVSALPGTLVRALQCFCVANAIRDLRKEGHEFGKEGKTHRSMLVNFSPYTKVQNQVEGLIAQRLDAIKSAIRNFSKLPVAEAMEDPELAGLHEAWKAEYASAWPDWESLQGQLLDAVVPIKPIVVNASTGPKALNYELYKDTGLRVIAVGGYSLSRGLTLEGLCVSYFRRNSQMYDTLMQMGRWFGYRPGYDDVCRIWLPIQAIDWYAHIAEASNEMRAEVHKMYSMGARPEEFGLKVRAHPAGLLITARNKMRSGKEVELVVSLDGRLEETVELSRNVTDRDRNAEAIEKFIGRMDTMGLQVESDGPGFLFRGNVRFLVSGLLRDFKTPDFGFNAVDIPQALDGLDADVWQEWDVYIPVGNAAEPFQFGARTIQPQTRFVIEGAPNKYIVSGTKRRVGSRGVEKIGLTDKQRAEAEQRALAAAIAESTPEKPFDPDKKISVADKYYRAVRQRPLLMLHFLSLEKDAAEPELADKRTKLGVHPALAVSFPGGATGREHRVRYRLNKVLLQQMYEPDEDDEAPELEAG